MTTTRFLTTVGLGICRGTRAFIVGSGPGPSANVRANAAAVRGFSSVLSSASASASASSLSTSRSVHGAHCRCASCSGGVASRAQTVRFMSSTELGEEKSAEGAYGDASGVPEDDLVRLYVGNLGWDTNSEDLQDAFKEFGDFEECFVVTNKATGESRGFGFVVYQDKSTAERAIEGMNGVSLDGRAIRVALSKPKGWASKREETGSTLYIGNLGYDTSDEQLRAELEKCGELSDVTVVTDRETGSSRGFAFATFLNPDDAQRAIEQMDGIEIDGRELRVNLSRPKGAAAAPRGGAGGYGGGAVDSCKLFVGNLGWETSSDDLMSTFAQYGEVVEAKVISDRETGNSRGFGFVTFSSSSSADQAVQQLDGSEMDGREIRVNISQPKKPRYQESYDDSW
jgi:nucleolin